MARIDNRQAPTVDAVLRALSRSESGGLMAQVELFDG